MMAKIIHIGTYEILKLDRCPKCNNPLNSTICHNCKSIWRFPKEEDAKGRKAT